MIHATVFLWHGPIQLLINSSGFFFLQCIILTSKPSFVDLKFKFKMKYMYVSLIAAFAPQQNVVLSKEFKYSSSCKKFTIFGYHDMLLKFIKY